MSIAIVTVLLAVTLGAAAVGGPRLLRTAAPALATSPRFAAVTVSAGAMVWIGALLAMGPAVAWVSNGPELLPQRAADVCRQCLADATPFAESILLVGIPAVVPLAIPVVGAVVVVGGLIREVSTNLRRRNRVASLLLVTGEPRELLGMQVLVVPDERPMAFAVGRGEVGTVVSEGTISTLTTPELQAVLAHECAHLRQRHHLWLDLFLGATMYFRSVPVVRAVRESVPEYLEIAADKEALAAGDPVHLARALLLLGNSENSRDGHQGLLHAAGPGLGGASDRIRSLVGTPAPRGSVVVALVTGGYVCLLTAAFFSVQIPYASAVLSGCMAAP